MRPSRITPPNGSTVQPAPAGTTSKWPFRWTFGRSARPRRVPTTLIRGMARGVFGPAFRRVVLDLEPEVREPRADEPRALRVELAGRIDGGNANQVGGERRRFRRRRHRRRQGHDRSDGETGSIGTRLNRILGANQRRPGIRNQELRTRRVPEADCLPDRRNDRDALPSRRRRTHRWHLRLHGAAARGATEAEGVVVPARALREDRGARARSDPRVLGPAGGDHHRARAPRACRCSPSTSAASRRSCR